MKTHPEVLKYRWTKENHPKGGRRPKPHVTITAALTDGLTQEAILDNKKSGITVAEAIAAAQLVDAMNGNLEAATFVAERTEGKVSTNPGLNGMGPVKEIEFRVIYDEPAINVEPGK